MQETAVISAFNALTTATGWSVALPEFSVGLVIDSREFREVIGEDSGWWALGSRRQDESQVQGWCK